VNGRRSRAQRRLALALTAKPGALALGFLPAHVANAADVPCTVTDLKNAIIAANSSVSPPTTITLVAGCTYTLTAQEGSTGDGLPKIINQVVIEGNGDTITRSTANGTGDFRIFEVGDNSGQTPVPGNLTLHNLTVSNGSAIASSSPFGRGGGILNNTGSTLTLNGSTVSGNKASSSFEADGGGIATFGNMTITNSTISGNKVTGKGVGVGGGIASFGTSAVSGSIISGNKVSITTAQQNSFPPPTAMGGGIAAKGGTLTVANSALSENAVSAGATASSNGPTVAAFGGGIAAKGSQGGSTAPGTIALTVTGSTLSGNSVTATSIDATKSTSAKGGGIDELNTNNLDTVTATVTNSTLTNNDVSAPSGVGTIAGGGIEMTAHSGDTLAVINSTLASATHSTGIDQNGAGAATLTNTILASHPGGNCHGTVADGGKNISFPATDSSCPGTFAKVDPALGPLQPNGGPTQTMALGTGSAAIDAANNTVCQAALPAGAGGIDQRGLPRSEVGGDTMCDVGAFEVQPLPPSPNPSPVSGQAAVPTTPKAGAGSPAGPAGQLVWALLAAPAAAAAAVAGLGRRRRRQPEN
jgi:hypothetical protein